MESFSEHSDIINGLASSGYAVIPRFISSTEVSALRLASQARRESGQFKSAGIGRTSNQHFVTDIRTDLISWLNLGHLVPAEAEFYNQLSLLKGTLNRELQLGLWDFEAHFAIYQPGGYYRRHLDRFQNNNVRAISTVLYLNDSWKKEDGGELLLYKDAEDQTPSAIVEPRAGTIVCFLSESIEHEVLESRNSERTSIAAWFRRREIRSFF